jgi:hypothetical protein
VTQASSRLLIALLIIRRGIAFVPRHRAAGGDGVETGRRRGLLQPGRTGPPARRTRERLGRNLKAKAEEKQKIECTDVSETPAAVLISATAFATPWQLPRLSGLGRPALARWAAPPPPPALPRRPPPRPRLPILSPISAPPSLPPG